MTERERQPGSNNQIGELALRGKGSSLLPDVLDMQDVLSCCQNLRGRAVTLCWEIEHCGSLPRDTHTMGRKHPVLEEEEG